MSPNQNRCPPVPPFSEETAIRKARMAEDAWNSRNPDMVALAYSIDSLRASDPISHPHLRLIKGTSGWDRSMVSAGGRRVDVG